jgi:hypothetical protein
MGNVARLDEVHDDDRAIQFGSRLDGDLALAE